MPQVSRCRIRYAYILGCPAADKLKCGQKLGKYIFLGMLPELSGQFLNIHLNSSRPQSVYSSSSSVFHSGELGPPAGWSGANSSHNSPPPSVSGALSSFPSEEQSTNSPLMTSSSYPNQPQLTRQSLQGKSASYSLQQ